MGILAGISIYISDKDDVTGQPIQTEIIPMLQAQ
jgi:hypothetical protein